MKVQENSLADTFVQLLACCLCWSLGLCCSRVCSGRGSLRILQSRTLAFVTQQLLPTHIQCSNIGPT